MKKLFTISEIKNSKVVFVGKNKLTNEIVKLFVKKIDELFNVFCLIDDEIIYDCHFKTLKLSTIDLTKYSFKLNN